MVLLVLGCLTFLVIYIDAYIRPVKNSLERIEEQCIIPYAMSSDDATRTL